MAEIKPPFSVLYGRYGGRYSEDFDTLEEAIEFAVADTDDYYAAEIKDGAGEVLYDHHDPTTDWRRRRDSLPEIEGGL